MEQKYEGFITLSVPKEKEKSVEETLKALLLTEKIQAKVVGKNTETDLRSKAKVTLTLSLASSDDIAKALGSPRLARSLAKLSPSFLSGSLVGLVQTRRDWEVESHIVFDWEEGLPKIQAKAFSVEKVLETPSVEKQVDKPQQPKLQ